MQIHIKPPLVHLHLFHSAIHMAGAQHAKWSALGLMAWAQQSGERGCSLIWKRSVGSYLFQHSIVVVQITIH